MRARRTAVSALSVDDDSAPDDAPPEPAPDDGPAPERVNATLRVCLECGGTGGERGDCPHREIAVFSAPDRATRELVTRLQQGTSAVRTARRALGSLVQGAVLRERAALEYAPPTPPPPPPPAPAAPELRCPQCEGERVPLSPAEGLARRKSARRARFTVAQCALPFAPHSAQPTDAPRDHKTSPR